MQKFIIAALSVLMLLSVSSTASAFSIGLLTETLFSSFLMKGQKL